MLGRDQRGPSASETDRVKEELDKVFTEVPQAGVLVDQLTTASDHLDIVNHMQAAAQLESLWPKRSSQQSAWRLGWIRAAQSAIVAYLQADLALSEQAAEARYRRSLEQWGEANWVFSHSYLALSDDPMDTADALTVIFMQAFLDLDRPDAETDK